MSITAEKLIRKSVLGHRIKIEQDWTIQRQVHMYLVKVQFMSLSPQHKTIERS